MHWPRSSGVLLHITSLPGGYGIGDFGPEARRFVDWLAGAKQSIWQVLPLAPTGYGDSPYQALSAFAGNPMLISPDDLLTDGLLEGTDLENAPKFPERKVNFEEARRFKLPLLRKAFERFHKLHELRPDYEEFEAKNSAWLDDFALFAALKHAHDERSWTEWGASLITRDAETIRQARERLQNEIAAEKFTQWIFARQWRALRDHSKDRGIRLMGDLPIYVAHDSADVWSHPELFLVDEQGRAKVVAGVPPDYFSATGQLWGNPIYDWKRHEQTGFAWWIARVRAMLEEFDFIRVDHFRGFEAYWAVPGGDATAENGTWIKAPGEKLFEALQSALGELPVLAENLGVITPEVETLRTRFRLPGMAILQFAFGDDPQAPYFKPHNYTHDRVAYTGTHDNDTVMGWWNRSPATSGESEEKIRAQHDTAKKYLPGIERGEAVNWEFIRALTMSVAEAVIFPMQDVLGLGTESRMNYPGTSSGNWRWRMAGEDLRTSDAQRLRELCETYER